MLLSQLIRPGLFGYETRPLTDVLHPADLFSSLKVTPDCRKTCSGVSNSPLSVHSVDGGSPDERLASSVSLTDLALTTSPQDCVPRFASQP